MVAQLFVRHKTTASLSLLTTALFRNTADVELTIANHRACGARASFSLTLAARWPCFGFEANMRSAFGRGARAARRGPLAPGGYSSW
jgi:hypothetical protein